MANMNASGYIEKLLTGKKDELEFRFLQDVMRATAPSAIVNAEQLYVLTALLANARIHKMTEGQRIMTAIQIATWINSCSSEYKADNLFESKIWD